MSFLGTLGTPQEDGTLTTSVCGKPTHTDLYLQWDSHHNMACKYSVINTHTHRAKAACSNSKLLEREMKHLQEVLSQCKYPKWAIDRVLQKQEDRRTKKQKKQKQNQHQPIRKEMSHSGTLFTTGLCESYKTICSKYGVQMHFKGGNTLKKLLMFPKDRGAITKQSNIIYWFKCGRTECDDEYIGESARTFEQRYKEHLKAPSPILNMKILLATQQQWRTSK